MMNADCLPSDRLIRLQWDGAFTRGNTMQPLSLRGTGGGRVDSKSEDNKRGRK